MLIFTLSQAPSFLPSLPTPSPFHCLKEKLKVQIFFVVSFFLPNTNQLANNVFLFSDFN